MSFKENFLLQKEIMKGGTSHATAITGERYSQQILTGMGNSWSGVMDSGHTTLQLPHSLSDSPSPHQPREYCLILQVPTDPMHFREKWKRDLWGGDHP